jgi:hypothetical protein
MAIFSSMLIFTSSLDYSRGHVSFLPTETDRHGIFEAAQIANLEWQDYETLISSTLYQACLLTDVRHKAG